MRYRARSFDCEACPLKSWCCPRVPVRRVPRSIFEGARDLAREIAKTDAYVTSQRQCKKVEMLFAHLKRILKQDRRRSRRQNGAHDEFLLAATPRTSANSPSRSRCPRRSPHERGRASLTPSSAGTLLQLFPDSFTKIRCSAARDFGRIGARFQTTLSGAGIMPPF